MQAGYLELILTWVAIIVPVLGAFGFLYRDTRRGFDRQDARMDRQDEKLDRVGADVTALQVSVARIEGYLGIGFPDPDLDRQARGARPRPPRRDRPSPNPKSQRSSPHTRPADRRRRIPALWPDKGLSQVLGTLRPCACSTPPTGTWAGPSTVSRCCPSSRRPSTGSSN